MRESGARDGTKPGGAGCASCESGQREHDESEGVSSHMFSAGRLRESPTYHSARHAMGLRRPASNVWKGRNRVATHALRECEQRRQGMRDQRGWRVLWHELGALLCRLLEQWRVRIRDWLRLGARSEHRESRQDYAARLPTIAADPEATPRVRRTWLLNPPPTPPRLPPSRRRKGRSGRPEAPRGDSLRSPPVRIASWS